MLQPFPEALFHHLLLAMVHPDRETHVGAHRIFSVVLVPSSVCPRPCAATPDPSANDLRRTLSRTVSVFSSSAALFGKLKRDMYSLRGSIDAMSDTDNAQQISSNDLTLYKLKPSQSLILSLKDVSLPSIDEPNPLSNSCKDMVYASSVWLGVQSDNISIISKFVFMLHNNSTFVSGSNFS